MTTTKRRRSNYPLGLLALRTVAAWGVALLLFFPLGWLFLTAFKTELQAIADVAHKYDMPLFVDGARLGYALTATGSDMTLADLATIADVFYIGGTKVGALFGEAVVVDAFHVGFFIFKALFGITVEKTEQVTDFFFGFSIFSSFKKFIRHFKQLLMLSVNATDPH